MIGPCPVPCPLVPLPTTKRRPVLPNNSQEWRFQLSRRPSPNSSPRQPTRPRRQLAWRSLRLPLGLITIGPRVIGVGMVVGFGLGAAGACEEAMAGVAITVGAVMAMGVGAADTTAAVG